MSTLQQKLTTALALASFALAISGVQAQPTADSHDDQVRAPSTEMLDTEQESPVGSGAESHERMAQTGRPDVRSGESVEDAKEEAGIDEE